MRRLSAIFLGLLVTAGVSMPELGAQSASPPHTYSFTEKNSMIVPDLTLKIYRDGSKELIDQSRPPSSASPQGFHTRSLYDFQGHKVYTWDLIQTARPCSASDYAEAAAPYETDVISGAAELAAMIAADKPQTVGTETVNGIAAKILEVPDPSGQGRTRIWLAEKSNYVIKWVIIPKTGPPQIQLEITNLSFVKAPASVFVLPAACKSI